MSGDLFTSTARGNLCELSALGMPIRLVQGFRKLKGTYRQINRLTFGGYTRIGGFESLLIAKRHSRMSISLPIVERLKHLVECFRQTSLAANRAVLQVQIDPPVI